MNDHRRIEYDAQIIEFAKRDGTRDRVFIKYNPDPWDWGLIQLDILQRGHEIKEFICGWKIKSHEQR